MISIFYLSVVGNLRTAVLYYLKTPTIAERTASLHHCEKPDGFIFIMDAHGDAAISRYVDETKFLKHRSNS